MNILIILLSLNLEGFYEYQGQLLKNGDDFSYTGYNKINLTLKEKISSAYFRVDLDYTSYHGKTLFDLRNFIPESVSFPIQYAYSSNLHFRNAFLRLRAGKLTIQMGRQQIGWGTGYAYNPTNVFQRKSILDPSYELDGVDAIRMFFDLTDNISFDALFLPDQKIDSSSYGLRVKSSFPLIDVSLGYLSYEKSFVNAFLTLARMRSYNITMDFSTDILGMGFHGEGIYDYKNHKLTGIMGMDYTLGDGITSLLIEYLYNENGKSSGNYSLQDWLGYLMGVEVSMARDKVFVNLERTFELLKVRLSCVYNIGDRSALIIPGVVYSFNDYTEVTITGYQGTGCNGTQYADMGSGLMFRIRTWF